MLGAERPDGEAPKPPLDPLETSLNHGHPACTLAPSLTPGLKHPSRGAGRVLSRPASPEPRPVERCLLPESREHCVAHLPRRNSAVRRTHVGRPSSRRDGSVDRALDRPRLFFQAQ